MNTLKLLVGWVFLAGLTAAGTFYAMDELDHRVGLARFNLHEKFGLVRSASVPVPVPPVPGPVPPAPIPAPAPINVTPPGPQPPISNPTPIPPVSPNPAPGPVVQPPMSNPAPDPVNTNPVNRNQRNPVNSNPVYRNPDTNPVNNNPVNPPANQQPNRPVYVPTQQPAAPSRPADFDEVNARYIDLSGQMDAMARFVDSVRRSNGAMGTGRLDGPMSSLRTSMRTAKQALDSGNTRTAKTYMDQAEKYLQALRELKDQ